jgi:hypothetical protein
MALHRRFFTRLAADFRNACPASTEESIEFAVWMHMVTITASALAEQNGMFNLAKFYEACGMPQDIIDRAAG